MLRYALQVELIIKLIATMMEVLNGKVFTLLKRKILVKKAVLFKTIDKNHGPDICPARDLWGAMLQGSF
jgi:hypothetical protein